MSDEQRKSQRDPEAEWAADYGHSVHQSSQRFIAKLEATLSPRQREAYRHIREGLEDIAAGRVREIKSVADIIEGED